MSIFNLFIVPSVIHPIEQPLSYYHMRSVFTPEQRYQQTLAQISSIREKVPDPYIVFVEASSIPHQWMQEIEDRVDLFIDASADPAVRSATDSVAKGYGEVAQLLHYLQSDHFKAIKDKCITVSKFGGRIKMSEDYTFQVPTRPRVRLETPTSMLTVLYTMPGEDVDDYIGALRTCTLDPDFIAGAHHASIEHKLFQLWLQNKPHDLVDRIGVEGFCAPFGTFYRI